MEKQNWNKFYLNKLEVIASIIETVSDQKIDSIAFNNCLNPKELRIRNGIQNLGAAILKNGKKILYNVVFTTEDVSREKVDVANKLFTMMACDLLKTGEISTLPAYSIVITTGKLLNSKEKDGWSHYAYANEKEEVLVDVSLIDINQSTETCYEMVSKISPWSMKYGDMLIQMLYERNPEEELEDDSFDEELDDENDDEMDEYEAGRADMLSEVIEMMTDLGVDPDLITLISELDGETELC